MAAASSGSGLLTAAQTPTATDSGPTTYETATPAATTTTPTASTPITPTTSGTSALPSLQSLETTNPGAGTFAASNTGTAADIGTTPTANATLASPLASIANGQINPNDSTNSASQLDAITNANSPYIQQAEQQGLLSAASRGLENSSIGAGSAEAAAVQAAAPLAEQNASAASSGVLQNSQLGTQAAEFNASQQNANQQLQAQLATQQTQFNASQTQAAAATNTAAQNAMTQQTMQLNEQMNQQYLSGTQSQSLASIQGQYNELIATNTSASSMYTAMMNGISSTMANQNIAPSRVADTIGADQSILESGLSVVDALNGQSLDVSMSPVATTNAGNDFTTVGPGTVSATTSTPAAASTGTTGTTTTKATSGPSAASVAATEAANNPSTSTAPAGAKPGTTTTGVNSVGQPTKTTVGPALTETTNEDTGVVTNKNNSSGYGEDLVI